MEGLFFKRYRRFVAGTLLGLPLLGTMACGLVSASAEEADAEPTRKGKAQAEPDSLGIGGATHASASAASAEAGVVASSGEEVCNGDDDDRDGRVDEGCPRFLSEGESFVLDGARLGWIEVGDEESPVLWTARLPHPEPEQVFEGTNIRFDVDGDRIVYARADPKAYVIVDLKDKSERLVAPLDPDGYSLRTPSLDGRYLSYSQSLPMTCGGWCDEEEVYLHDLEVDASAVVASHAGTIQIQPIVSRNHLVWLDDRHGHHLDGGSHWFDIFAAELPYEGSFTRVTAAQAPSLDLVTFEKPLALVRHVPAPGISVFEVMDVIKGEYQTLSWAVAPGETVLDLSPEYLLVRKDPLGSCHLALAHLESESVIELNTDGICPTTAQLDGDFVAWTQVAGSSSRIHWMDVSDLSTDG